MLRAMDFLVATLAIASGVWLLACTPKELRGCRSCSSLPITSGAVLLAMWLIKVLIFHVR